VPHIVHTPHGHVFDGYFLQPVTQLYIRLERWAALFTDRMIALTDDEIETYLRHGIGTRDQYAVIASGVELEPFRNAGVRRDAIREELGVRDAVVIGAAGRLEPVKGFDVLLSAAEHVRREIPNACFLIVGQGSREAELKRQAAPLGGAVRFLGYREDIAHIMAGCDIIAVPSRNEGMGRVVVEAGAAGLPVVATAVGGLPHVVDHERTGILTPPRDARSLADALVRLARDPALRATMGEAARRKMIPAFGVGAMVSAIEAVYDELMKEETRADRR
jgi:glycosyltransferase involved in cell wall biosynthesis